MRALPAQNPTVVERMEGQPPSAFATARYGRRSAGAVGLIRAGKFGSMFLSQVPTIRGLKVPVIHA
jgi:hypothetical protein